ncbi:MAG TPA: TIR domain-containing protein [Candidatus Kapabacteria bacterium]|nr:TIR domain-containing protein [Candidatus Kapabacteria bacterium]
MSDIFISYSRQDAEQAQLLTELLTSAGLSCWIDKSGIDLATSWSKEIVQAIDQCKAFVVLLSSASNESTNVHKELSLASEKKKKILPLDLEPVALSEEMQYHLAGIQRAQMTNIDAVIRALAKLGLEATGAPQPPKIVKETDGRKSLMILPFEDLSPTADNAWFADGLATELISALSNVKALRVTDQQTTKEFKKYTGHLTTYAKEMSIRYFIQGSVRKFGDQIKITSALLDIETGDHLWQDSMKGTMSDIFDIQEKVAEKVVEGLKVHLASDEKKKLAERGTENAEAFEYAMRAEELNSLQTRDGFRQAISLFDLALTLDPLFIDAILNKTHALIVLFKHYEQDSSLLREAEQLLKRVEELKPGAWQVHDKLSNIYLAEGRTADAEREHQQHIATDDGSALSKGQLGFFCFATKQFSRAFGYYEAALTIGSSDVITLWNVIVNARLSKNIEGLNRWSDLAISTFQKRLRLHPEDASARYQLAATYFWMNPSQRAKSLSEINILESILDLDSIIQYQVAMLLVQQGEHERAIEALRKAIKKGVAGIDKIRKPDSTFAPLFGHPRFEAVMKDAESKTYA